MEKNEILDADNEVDLFCLNFTCMDLLKRHMKYFQNTWNCHPVRTERNMTPEMLFEGGLLALQQQQDDKNLENQEDFTELYQV